MSGGVEVQMPCDTILSEHHRRRPQLLYLPMRSTSSSATSRRRPKCHTTTTSPTESCRIRQISAPELVSVLQKDGCPLVLDCRPTLSFGRGHVTGAVSVRCSDRISRRRLQLGRLGLCDLVSDPSAKERLKQCQGLEVVVYDEATADADLVVDDHPVAPVVSSLWDMGARPVLLQGGWRGFSKSQSESCSSLPSPSEEESPSSLSYESPRATAILPFLYVGNEKDAENVHELKKLGIGYVLNVTSQVPGYCNEQGFTFLRLPAADSYQQNLKQYFKEAFAFIDEARKQNSAILVHCQAGVSRSATIVIGYLMYHTHLSSMEAYQVVKSKRPIISPNLHFMGQLLELEQILQENECPVS